MKLERRDFQRFKMISSVVYFFPCTLNNGKTMTRRDLKTKIHTASMNSSFQSTLSSCARKDHVAIFRRCGISINTLQMNVKHYALRRICQRMAVPTLATRLKSSNYGKNLFNED